MPAKSATPVTLQHVADSAGVSVSTASRILSGKAAAYRISQRAEKLVRQAAQKLGFRPSQVARSLRSKRSGLLGVMLPDVANPFFAAIAREVTVAAEAAGYSVILADSREDTATEQTLLDQLRSRNVEGLVICPVGASFEHLEAAYHAGLPLVLVDRVFAKVPMVQVTSDHAQGAADLTKLLLAEGHSHLGILQGIPHTLPNAERLKGIRASLDKRRINLSESQIVGDQFTEASGHQAAQTLLSQRTPPTALFAFSNLIALGALRACAERGLVVGKDISLVSFDDHPFMNYLRCPITSAAQDIRQLGLQAAERIIQQLQSGSRPAQKMLRIPCTIQHRQSIVSLLPTLSSPRAKRAEVMETIL